jgi:hypothetical protein
MSEVIAAGQHLRLEHRVAPAPGTRGESSTVIRRGGEVTVDLLEASGSLRRFHSRLQAGVHDRVVELLRTAGFPEAPREIVRTGRTRVLSAISGGRELRTRPIAHDTRARFWADAFAMLDAIAEQTSSGAVASSNSASDSLVSGATELSLFVASPGFEEPPLGEDANAVVAEAWKIAAEKRHREVVPAHLLVAFVREHGYQLTRLGLAADRVLVAAESLLTWDDEPGQLEASAGFELVPGVARRVAAEDGAHEGSLRHLLRALLEAGGADVTRVLQQHRLPDAFAAGRTRDRIFALPEAMLQHGCTRCGAPAPELNWCLRCGHALAKPAAEFATGSDLDRVVARIQPHDFGQRDGIVHRSLCSLPDQAGTPWLVFELAGDDGPELVTHQRLSALGTDAQRLEQAALTNLSRAPASWTPRWVPGADGREIDVLFCVDDPDACERILERPFLLHAQAMLGTNTLAGAVPRRGMLLLARLEDLTVLMALCRRFFDEADADPISPWGFAIQNGEISGPFSSA